LLSSLAATPLKNAYLFEMIHLEKEKEREGRLAAEETSKVSREMLEIINKDLVAAKEKAEEGNRLKTEFLANMSHELRTPLTSIIGFSKLIEQQTASSSEIKEFAEIINKQGGRLLAMINDLLDLSKLEMDTLAFQFSWVNLNSVIQEAVLSLEQQIGEKKHRVVERLEEGIPDLWLDRNQSVKIFSNLISNAVKFAPQEGEIVITTSAKEGVVEATVLDKGIGIKKEDQEIIFDRFRQLDGSPTRRHGGVGLGLDLVKRLVEKMEGKIRLESTPGQGSSFYISFPIARHGRN
jgi:signal transduction histidine kinase